MAADARNVIAASREKRLSVDKYPMLPKLADEITDLAVDLVRTRLATPVQFHRVEIFSDREEALLASFGSHCLAAILHDPEWNCNVAAILRGDFVYTLVEVMLGADGADRAYAEERPFSTIERTLSKNFVDGLVEALNRAITPMHPLDLTFEKFEQRLEFVTLGARGDDAVAVRYKMESLGRGGELVLILPQRALSRIGEQLAQSPTSAPRRPDPQWTKDFEERVTGAEIPISAYAEVGGYRLFDVAAFRQGQVLTLPDNALHDVTLTAEGRRLFTCELGQTEGRYSVRVVAEYDPEAARKTVVHAIGS